MICSSFHTNSRWNTGILRLPLATSAISEAMRGLDGVILWAVDMVAKHRLYRTAETSPDTTQLVDCGTREATPLIVRRRRPTFQTRLRNDRGSAWLRPQESGVSRLTIEDFQQREEHWVIADLVGKGGHVRTVPVPT